ncbi:MAG TPA: gamma-glutamyltransferase [Gemmatimonadaceae bacterium]|nr:gamma-glutamyltransferase [Gemmatimonadaceae bacterium]
MRPRLALSAVASFYAVALHAQIPRADWPTTPVSAPRTMVVSASRIASAVGDSVLRAGGNAVDAAIATGFALAVTYPTAGNIGGGGFMVIRFPDGRATTIDFREKAPLAANERMFLDSTGKYSYERHHESHLAVGVPGTVAGFDLAHRKYGRKSWRSLVDPAVRLARDGFVAPAGLAQSLSGEMQRFQRYPATVVAYSRNGTPYAQGDSIRFPDLARTLDRIARQGRAGFYAGETARLIAAEMKRGGGIVSMRDLALYQAKERAPIRGTYRGYDIISMPPPSSGGIAIVEMLNILEGFNLASAGHNSAQHIHLETEAMRRAFRDRAHWLGDPDFNRLPVARLTSKSYASEQRATIDPHHASPSGPADVADAAEAMHTTHYSVVDASGMAVSVTYTLEYGYGSAIVVPGAGFLLNNEMGDFNAQRGMTTDEGYIGTLPNLVRPQQRMLSSMSPTIVAKNGRLVAVVGSPGGRTIINTVFQVVSNVIDFDMNIQQAVNAARIHHQWLPDTIYVEDGGISSDVVQQLEAMGHHVSVGGEQGTAHSIFIDARTRARLGAADPRDPDAGAVGH